MTKYYSHPIVMSIRCPHCKSSIEELFNKTWYVNRCYDYYDDDFICPVCKKELLYKDLLVNWWITTPFNSDDYVESVDEIERGICSKRRLKTILNKNNHDTENFKSEEK